MVNSSNLYQNLASKSALPLMRFLQSRLNEELQLTSMITPLSVVSVH